MADEPTVRGWLPPHAPGGQPPPRFEPPSEGPAATPEEIAQRDAAAATGRAAEPDPQPPASEWLPPTAVHTESAGWHTPTERAASAGGQAPAGSRAWQEPTERAASAGDHAPAESPAWREPTERAASAGDHAPAGSPAWREPAPSAGWQAPADRSASRWGPPPVPPDAAGPTTLAHPDRAPAPAGALAITAVALGSLGLALLVLSLGTSFLLSLPCSGIAWACGAKARRRVDADPAAGRRGTAQTGIVLGMVGVGLGLLSAIVWIVLISAGITIDDLRDYLERKLREQRRQSSGASLSIWLDR